MSLGSKVFSVVRKIFLVNEELARLAAEVKELAVTTREHEVRLAVIENTLTLTRRSSKLILPGN